MIEVEGVNPDDFTMASISKRFRKGGDPEGRVQEVTQPDLFSLHYRL